jgi:hypothetical protein
LADVIGGKLYAVTGEKNKGENVKEKGRKRKDDGKSKLKW